jgi:uncharacterized protein (TIGR02996 family)
MRTFQFSDAKSHKFWNIDVSGKSFTATWGKIGTPGQSQTKSFPTGEKAQAEADKLIKEKTKKGYVETTPTASVSDAEAFQKALIANPHDLAGWCAYAEYLVEQGDPRGEFMQTQIALEDESRPKKERDALKKREKELLKKHEQEWVGDWADNPDVGGATDEWAPPEGWVPYRFTRGMLTSVELGALTVAVARQVVKAPQLGFVRELIVHGIQFQEEGDYEAGPDTAGVENEDPAQYVLVRWPQLRHIRVFRFGGCEPYDYTDDWPHSCHTPGALIADFVKQMPDIEELRIMAHFHKAMEAMDRIASFTMYRLHTLLLYHGWDYPLDTLARNASLSGLRELYCHPHAHEGDEDGAYIRLSHLRAICRSTVFTNLTHLQLRLADFGDEGIQEIIKSGLLKRLKVLDLRHGLITDEGAKALAACPDLKNITHLDLGWNRLSEEGIAALTKTGIAVTLIRQRDANTDSWETFGQGDIE